MTDTWGYIPCQNSHVIIFNSITTIDILPPAGSPCMCGQMVADGKGGGISADEYDRVIKDR